jgi:hypothetical protein
MSRIPQAQVFMLIVLSERKTLEKLFVIRNSRRSANDDRFVCAITLMSQWKRARRIFARSE